MMSATRAGTFRKLGFLLIAVIAAHNFEEWLTFPHFGEVMGIVAEHVGLPAPQAPAWPVTQMALILVTILPALTILWANSGRASAPKASAVCWIASIFLANVFIPHIPASIVLQGYSPGIATAVLINLPFCLLLLASAQREHLLTRGQVAIVVAAGVASLPVALICVFAVARMIAG